MPIKRWNVRRPDEAAAKRLASELGLPLIAVRVLAGRGYDTREKIERFLSPDGTLTDPLAIRDMDKAVARIRRALSEGERIAVYGDYDCDGIMSTVVLYSYLESAGADVCYYIPQRDREGYGLNREALKLIHDDGVRLVITVDNGITAIGEVEYASSLGLDVVITDHHKPREVLPAAAAVVDPHRLDDESGCEYLAGVGVAFKLICALEGDDGELMLDQYGDLVAVATVADIVPLTGENRTIVRRGLESLQNTDNEGLAALIRVCGMADKSSPARTSPTASCRASIRRAGSTASTTRSSSSWEAATSRRSWPGGSTPSTRSAARSRTRSSGRLCSSLNRTQRRSAAG